MNAVLLYTFHSSIWAIPEGLDQLGVTVSDLLQALLNRVPEGPLRELDLLDMLNKTVLQGGAKPLQTGESGRISEKINHCFHLLSSSVVNNHF